MREGSTYRCGDLNALDGTWVVKYDAVTVAHIVSQQDLFGQLVNRLDEIQGLDIKVTSSQQALQLGIHVGIALDLVGDDRNGLGSLEVKCSLTNVATQEVTHAPAQYTGSSQIVCDLANVKLEAS